MYVSNLSIYLSIYITIIFYIYIAHCQEKSRMYISSVIRQKGESQNDGHKKTKSFQKLTFLSRDQGERKVTRRLEMLSFTYFTFL